MRRAFYAAILLAGCGLVAGVASAGKTNCRLERIDASKYQSDDVLRAYVSVVEVEGNVVDDKGPKTFTLRANGKPVGQPQKAEKFENTGEPLDLVLIIETSALYGPPKAVAEPVVLKGTGGQKPKKAPPKKAERRQKGQPPAAPAPDAPPPAEKEPLLSIKDAALTFLDDLNQRWRVLLIDYASGVQPHPPFRAPASLGDEIDNLSSDVEAQDLRLVEAVSAALIELNKPRTDGKIARKAIVVVSDGLNYQMDRKIFKGLGDKAAAANIPIHTIAFSPTDDRGPLLNLGEISKRSNGTLRWAKTQKDLDAQFETLIDELKKQYVLTFKADIDGALDRKLFNLTCEDVTSNNFVIPKGKVPKGTAWWVWLLAGLGGLVVIGIVAAIIINNRTPVMIAPGAHMGGGQMPMPGGGGHAAAPASAILIGVSGDYTGQKIQLSSAAAVSFGKGPSTVQTTSDPTVSTRHCEIAYRNGVGFVITDVGSTNGTYVNNQRIAQPTLLSDGDLVKLGSGTQFRFKVG